MGMCISKGRLVPTFLYDESVVNENVPLFAGIEHSALLYNLYSVIIFHNIIFC